MAIVKDLIVLGSTRQIGPAYAGTIYAESFVKNGSDSSHVLLGDGSDLALSSLNSSHTHYVGTTQVQNSSAAQGLTGITSIASPASTALYMSSASTLYLDSAASTSILFRKGTTEMARFNTSSNLCVGTTNPNDNTAYKLDVGGKGRFSNQIVSSLASGTAPFVVASSTVVSNLNADLLDGKHASAFALSSHDHKRILFNDTRSNVETPTNVAAYDGIRIDFKTKTASSIPSTGQYTAIVSFDGYSDTSGGYPSQMGFSMSDLSESRPFYFRSPKTASQWGAWRCMLDSLTYTSYTVDKQGLGAAGTWDISITGNAATATNADKLDNFHAAELLTNVDMYAGGNLTKIDVTIGGTTLTGSVIVPYASNAGSVDWDDITNIPGEFALSSHDHDDRYVTALGTSGNYVTWTKNGTTHNLTVPYATNAGTASSVPWSGVTSKPSYLYSYQASAAQTTVDWARNVAYSSVTRRAFIYNNSSTKWNYLFGFSSSSTSDGKSRYGAVLKWGYDDNYIRMQRQYNGVWKTEDWEKISAGKADTATTATKLSTVSKTAWGQTFWTSDGVPTSISGDMTSVGSISASGNIITEKSDTTSLKVSTKNSNGEIGIYTATNRGLYDFTGSKWIISTGGSGTYTFLGLGNVGIGTTTTPTVKLDVAGSIKSSDTVQAVKFKTTSYEISQTTGGRLAFGMHGQAVAAPVNVGNLLVSNAWADYTNVPTNGIYAKGNIKTAAQLVSSAASGTAPLVVSSTTKVNNLNADFLDGEHSHNLRSRPDNGGDVLFSMIPYINARVNPFSSSVDIDVAPGDAPFGYCFGPTTNYVTYVSGYIPVMPGDTIKGETYAYRDVDATGTNTGVLYCGISRFDRNKKPITSNNGTQYFVNSSTTVPSDGVWHKYSGTTTIPTTHTIYNGSDGGGVYYVKIVFYVNYNHNSAPPTYIGGCQFTRISKHYDSIYLKTSGGTMTGAISRNYDAASSVPVLNVASTNQDIWLWRVRSGDTGTSSSVDKVYGFGAKYLGTGTGNNNSWAMYADNQNGTQIKALEMKQSGDLFAYAPIHWANDTALPQDTSPNYILTVDSFANGGKTKWTSKANLATSIGLGNYLPLSGGTITGDLTIEGNTTIGDANGDTVTNIIFNDVIDFTNLKSLWGSL